MRKVTKHVVPNGSGGWAVKNSGALRASKIFDTQQQAVAYGQEAAKKNATALYIHGRDGMIQRKDSYRPDPVSPKSKRYVTCRTRETSSSTARLTNTDRRRLQSVRAGQL